jgi:hypothetical protein
MAGAVVRHGNGGNGWDRAVPVHGRAEAPVRLDETSLPIGIIADAAAASAQQKGTIAIGVIRTAQVDVQLVPTADSSGRLPNVDLNGIPLQALDSAGNAWAARTDAGGLAHFFALPPGRYRVQVDVSGLRERLRVGPLPVFTVEPQRVVPLQKVQLYPRPLRMFPIRVARPGPAAQRHPVPELAMRTVLVVWGWRRARRRAVHRPTAGCRPPRCWGAGRTHEPNGAQRGDDHGAPTRTGVPKLSGRPDGSEQDDRQ